MRTAEINTRAEMQTLVEQARSQEVSINNEAAEMEREAAEIAQELILAETAAQRKEEAERAGKESKEKINEFVG